MQSKKSQQKTMRGKKFSHSVIGTKITLSNKPHSKTREEELIDRARKVHRRSSS